MSIFTYGKDRNGSECRTCRDEHKPSPGYGLAGEQDREKCSAMHTRRLTAFAQSCEARRAH
jgi:hypothetical protein